MKRMVVIAAALLVLSGCSADVSEEAAVEPETAQETEIAPAPLTAESAEKNDPLSPEDAYLELIRGYADRGPEIADATDEELISAGLMACEQFAEGKVHDDVRVVDGEQPNQLGTYPISSAIAGSASQELCID